MTTKTCKGCGMELPLTEEYFYKGANKNGFRTICKSCDISNVTEYRKRHPDKVRNTMLKHRYGITLDEYNSILKDQKGVCAICEKECLTGRRLAVDHDHDTGHIRGLLCTNCNRGIGHMQESIELLEKAIIYLKEGKDGS